MLDTDALFQLTSVQTPVPVTLRSGSCLGSPRMGWTRAGFGLVYTATTDSGSLADGYRAPAARYHTLGLSTARFLRFVVLPLPL